MWGLGSTLCIRGPAPQPDTDPWGAVTYNSDSLLVLEAESIFTSENATIQAGELSLIADQDIGSADVPLSFTTLALHEVTSRSGSIWLDSNNTDVYIRGDITALGDIDIRSGEKIIDLLDAVIHSETGSVNLEPTKGDINIYGTVSAPEGIVRFWTCGAVDLRGATVISKEGGYVYNSEDVIYVQWVGPDTGNWNVGANWSGGNVPNSNTYSVEIYRQGGTGYTVNILATEQYTIGALYLGRNRTDSTGNKTCTLNVGDNLTIDDGDPILDGSLSIFSPGVLNLGTKTLTVDGNFSNAGTFNVTTGAVEFTGTADAIISGNTTFNNLTCTVAGKKLYFASGSTQTVGGTLTITGTSGNLITLARSGGTDPDQWNMNVTGSSSVTYASVSNSNATGNSIILSDSADGGNNTNWLFRGIANYLKITGSTTMTAGGSNNVTITAYDALNDVVTSYAGDKDITFSGAGVAPDSTSPTALDKDAADIDFGTATTITFASGAGTSVIKLYKAESAEVEVTDGTISSGGDPSYDLNVTVAAGAADHLKITGTATMTAGQNNELTVTACDDYGNTATSYAGAKNLTFSGLSNAPVGNIPTVEGVNLGSPTSVNFTAGTSDAGVATLVAYKAETASLNVTDGTIGSSGDPSYELDLTVNPAAKNKLLWATQPSSPVVAGATWASFSIEIVDAYGNRTADNAISIKLTPSSGTLSGTTTQSSVAGLATYNDISCTTAATITLVGASSGAWKESTPASDPVTIKADVAAYMTITSPSSATIAGVSITATITAFDQYDNVATDYVGDKNITFSGATASPNPVTEPTASDKNAADIDFGDATTITFTAGAGTTTIKLYKVEAARINVTDGVISSTGAPQYKLDVNVTPAAASKLLWVTAPTTSSAKVGDTWADFVSIEVTDPWGNRTNDIVAVTMSNSQASFNSGTVTKNTVASFVTFDDLVYKFLGKGTVNFYGSAAGLESTPFAAVTVEPVWIDPGTIYIMLPDFVYGIEGFFPASLLYDLFAEILWYIDVDGMGAIVNISEDQSDKKKKPRSVKKGGLSWIEVIKKRWEGRVSPSSN